MFAAVRVSRSAATLVQRRTFSASTANKDPVVNVFMQELKKAKSTKGTKPPTTEQQKLAKEIESLKNLEGIKELGVKIGGK